MAKKAFDDAFTEISSVSEDYYKDSNIIMRLLQDNLNLWSSEAPDAGGTCEIHYQKFP
jgi:14-3-3 protein epsilon